MAAWRLTCPPYWPADIAEIPFYRGAVSCHPS